MPMRYSEQRAWPLALLLLAAVALSTARSAVYGPLLAARADALGCQLPVSMPLVNQTVGNATVRCPAAGGYVTPGGSCQIYCVPGALLLGGPSFMCAADGTHWLAQQSCQPYTPVVSNASPFATSLSLSTVLSRSSSAAAEEVRQHAALGTTTNATGLSTVARAVRGAMSSRPP